LHCARYGLDYPDEVKALVDDRGDALTERPRGAVELRLKAAEDAETYQKWLDLNRHNMMFIDPDLRERLVECHRKVGPMSQHDDFLVIDQFDVRERIHTLKPPLLLIRGVDDPGSPPEYEMEIHRAVPGSQYLKLNQAGHFPWREAEEFNGHRRVLASPLISLEALRGFRRSNRSSRSRSPFSNFRRSLRLGRFEL
jgi:pimeloyl-ACP methyl ester carboxylesterase